MRLQGCMNRYRAFALRRLDGDGHPNRNPPPFLLAHVFLSAQASMLIASGLLLVGSFSAETTWH
jgi:hypothetical protein